VKYSRHALQKITERNISRIHIDNTISEPDIVANDKFDPGLLHFIKKIDERFLRVIVNDKKKLIVSAFFDRRIKKD